jgi:hypothetical protein
LFDFKGIVDFGIRKEDAMAQRTSVADRNVLGEELKKAFREGRSYVMLEDKEINIDDILKDFDRFISQSAFYIRNDCRWPSVVIDRIDFTSSCLSARTIPMDIPAVEARSVKFGEWQEVVQTARGNGLPIVERSVDEARRGFFQGSIDAIFGRGRWKLFSSTDPEVTVKTRTGVSVLAMFSDGRFFNTARAFGNTEHKKRIPAGSYCFYRKTIRPTNSLEVYDIEDDETIEVEV